MGTVTEARLTPAAPSRAATSPAVAARLASISRSLHLPEILQHGAGSIWQHSPPAAPRGETPNQPCCAQPHGEGPGPPVSQRGALAADRLPPNAHRSSPITSSRVTSPTSSRCHSSGHCPHPLPSCCRMEGKAGTVRRRGSVGQHGARLWCLERSHGLTCNPIPTACQARACEHSPAPKSGWGRCALPLLQWRGQRGDGTEVPHGLAEALHLHRSPGAIKQPVWIFISPHPFHLLSPFHVSTFFSLQAAVHADEAPARSQPSPRACC